MKNVIVYLSLAFVTLTSCSPRKSMHVELGADSISTEQIQRFESKIVLDTLRYPLSTSFFQTWDSISNEYAILHNDTSIINQVFQKVFFHYNYKTKSYYVLPPYVTIRTYRTNLDRKKYLIDEIDGIKYKIALSGEGKYIPHLTTDIPVLYHFSSIEKSLSNYLGGIKDDIGRDINDENVQDLRQYIQVNYGHWGGYWHLESMPIIYAMCFFNNGVLIYLRDSWCTGIDVFMPYGTNDFEELSNWME